MILPGIHIEAIIISELFAGPNNSLRENPDTALDNLHLAVGVTRVIDEPRPVPRHVTVDVVLAVEREQIDMPRTALARAVHLFLGKSVAVFDRNQLADVLDNLHPFGDRRGCIDAPAVLSGFFYA